MVSKTKTTTTFFDNATGNCDCACPNGDAPRVKLAYPKILTIEITPFCDNDCLGCCNLYTHLQSNLGNPLNINDWKLILSAAQPNLERVKISGGEPTLSKNFWGLLTLLRDMQIPFDIFSNARWKHPEKLIDTLLDNKFLGGILVSLHGYNSSSHEFFTRVSGSFNQSVKNIRMATDSGIPIALSTIIHRENFDKMEEIIQLAESIGASRVIFNRFVGAKTENDIAPSTVQFLKAVKDIENFRKKGHPVKFSVCIPQCFIETSSSGCLAGIASCTIDSYGNVRACNHSPAILGNTLSTKLIDIWESNSLSDWRGLPSQCRNCIHKEVCNGGCRADAELKHSMCDTLINPILSSQEESTHYVQYTA